jgi:hypothetical protein
VALRDRHCTSKCCFGAVVGTSPPTEIPIHTSFHGNIRQDQVRFARSFGIAFVDAKNDIDSTVLRKPASWQIRLETA